MEGFTVCIVYSSCDNCTIEYIFDLPSISVINKSKSTSKLNERPFSISLKISKEDHIWQVNFPTSELNLEASDEVEVIADFGSGIHVKKIGICPIYGRVIDGKMIHYASISNKDAIVVRDDGDVSIDQVSIESKEALVMMK